MLLSMYLLYRFARSGKSWTYVFDIGLFVVLISFVSALIPVTEFVIFSFPVSFLSFPFYFWSGELAAPEALRGSYPWLPCHSVRFLTANLNLTPDWALNGSGIATGPQFYSSAFGFAFLVLLLANMLGGVLGYFVGRRYALPAWGEVRLLLVGVASVVLAFVGAIFVVNAFPSVSLSIVEPVFDSVFGFGTVVVDIVFLWFLIGLAERSRVASLMVLGGLVLVLAGGEAGLVLVVTGGWTLVVLGGLVYFGKETIDYVRIREAEARAREESGSEAEE